jgi:glycyl-tRNA synthetase
MEIEYFVEPGTEGPLFEGWKDAMWQWCLDIGLSPERLRIREHTKEELSHYFPRT